MTIVPVVSVLLICLLAAPVFTLKHIVLNVFGQLVCNAHVPFKAEIALLEYDRASPDEFLGSARLESHTNIAPFNFTVVAEHDGAGDDLELYWQISHNCNSMDHMQEKLRYDTDITEVKEEPKLQDVNFRSIDITNRGDRGNWFIEKNVIEYENEKNFFENENEFLF